jgi:hypothetical protein
MLPLMKTVCGISACSEGAIAEQSAKRKDIRRPVMEIIFVGTSPKVEPASHLWKKTVNPVNSFSFIGFAYWTLFRMKRIVAPFFRGKRTEKQISFCQ